MLRAAAGLDLVDELDEPVAKGGRNAQLPSFINERADDVVNLGGTVPDGDVSPRAGVGLEVGTEVFGHGIEEGMGVFDGHAD